MNTSTRIFRLLPLFVAAALVAPISTLRAQSADETDLIEVGDEIDLVATQSGAAAATDRISESFVDLAGSEENAAALVAGLRNGSEITFTTPGEGDPVETVFTPATEGEGYGNVFISLALAQKQLNDAGVDEPTPDQLIAALNGGSFMLGEDTIDLQGVLALRAEGMGWGEIARSLDLRLGEVVSGIRSARGRGQLGEGPANADVAGPRGNALGLVNRPERAEQPGRPDRPERPEAASRPERPVRPERVERPERPERPDRPGRP